VDNDRLAASGGFEYAVKALGGTLKTGIQLQLHRLLPRETRKLATPTSADGINRHPHLVADEVPDDAVLNGEPVRGRQGLQTNNPGWPGFSSEGWILGGGINVSLLL
jgi:hypothetical protein